MHHIRNYRFQPFTLLLRSESVGMMGMSTSNLNTKSCLFRLLVPGWKMITNLEANPAKFWLWQVRFLFFTQLCLTSYPPIPLLTSKLTCERKKVVGNEECMSRVTILRKIMTPSMIRWSLSRDFLHGGQPSHLCESISHSSMWRPSVLSSLPYWKTCTCPCKVVVFPPQSTYWYIS